MANDFLIRRAVAADAPLLFDHDQRHMDESGRDGDVIFHPVLDYKTRIREESIRRREQRWAHAPPHEGSEISWIALKDGQIRGHLGLATHFPKAAAHRVLLAMGLERSARGHGLGRKLMDEAITWAREHGFVWIDLHVFTNNLPAIALYEKVGFKAIGTVEDIFRVHGTSIHDTHMVLKL